jgi:FkbM family methyltransferase
MPVPFYRTIKQARQNGFVKTVSMLLVLSFRSVLANLKYLPKTAIVEVNNSKMFLLPRKADINQDLFVYKKREPICTNYLIHSGILKEGDVALDIGANIGYYVLIESQIVGKKGHVYAVEPVLSTFKQMQKNVRLNNSKNISTFQLAFGAERNEKSAIYVSGKSNLSSMSRDAVGGTLEYAQEVVMETVDNFLKDKASPNIVRMDVEGFEYEIIRGMHETLKENVKILVELHPLPRYMKPGKMDEIFQILEQNNFKVRFAVFEDKVEENRLIRFLLKKAGDKLPIINSNMSIPDFRKILKENIQFASPNVVFEKQIFSSK